MQVANIDINKLIPYINNPRNNEEAIDKVASSIKEFGFKVPIVVDKDNVIVTGHTRLLASKKLGLKEVPVVVADDLTDAQIKAFRIADNKVSEYATWDEELLKLELEQLEEMEFDLDLVNIDYSDFDFAIDLEEIEDIEKEEVEEVEEIENVPTRVKFGDVWKLGKHTLICGDSFDDSTFKRLIKDKKADLGFCDPPYDLDEDEWIGNLEFVKNGHPILLMAGDKQTVRLTNKIDNFRQFIIHDRENAMLVNTSTPMSQHTVISLFCDHPKQYFNNLNDHFTSIIQCKKNYKVAGDELHSKMGKPLKVISELIQHYSKPNDIILDYFAGGGSVLITCEQLNRVCYMNELDEKQCDIIIARWENFTGKKAMKIN